MLTIVGHSRALFSTWIHVQELGIVFDAGEGVNQGLGGKLGAVDTIAISHGHTDHFTGLMNAIITRRRLGGAPLAEKPPLRVVYPRDDAALAEHVAYLTGYFKRIGFGVGPEPGMAFEPVPVVAGDVVALPGGGRTPRQLRAFRVDHTRDVVSLGYLVEEERRRLKPELQGLPGPELARLAAEKGREALSDPFLHKLVCYSGDTRPVATLPAADADVLLHEATFASRDDVNTEKHSALPDVLALVGKLDPMPRSLVLCHLSTRYARSEFQGRLKQLLAERPLGVPVRLLDEVR